MSIGGPQQRPKYASALFTRTPPKSDLRIWKSERLMGVPTKDPFWCTLRNSHLCPEAYEPRLQQFSVSVRLAALDSMRMYSVCSVCAGSTGFE